MAAAAVGDSLNVQNVASKKVIDAVATGAGEAVVRPGRPAPARRPSRAQTHQSVRRPLDLIMRLNLPAALASP